jgi:hypothetical protein
VKRTLLFLFALFSFALAASVTASAGQWVQKEIYWHLSSRGSPLDGTAIFQRDTLYGVFNSEAVDDTTGAFSLDDADPIPWGAVAPGIAQVSGIPTAMYAYKSDTTVAAFLVFQPDSSGPPTATVSAMTWIVEGRAVGTGSVVTNARGWVKADSALVNGAAGGTLNVGMESVSFPIRTITPYGNIRRWGQLRARASAITGILSGRVRAFVRYWDDDK